MARGRPEVNVVVAGGGVAGLTAALRLAQRGYKVTVYEQEGRIGGSLGVSPEDSHADHEVYPHMFANWYKNFWELVETDLGLKRGEDFIERTNCKYLRVGEFPRFTQMTNVGSPWTAVPNLLSGLAPIPDMLLYGYSLIDLLSYNFTPYRLLNRMTVNGFIASRWYATTRMAELHDTCLQTIWSVHSDDTSVAAYKHFIKYGFRHPVPEMWVVNGTAYHKVIEPLHQKLKRLGCEIKTNASVTRVVLDDEGRVDKILVQTHATGAGRAKSHGRPQWQSVDYLILAVPPEALWDLIMLSAEPDGPRMARRTGWQRIVDARPQLAEVGHLRSEPVPVLNLHFKKRLPGIPKEYVALLNSRYALSFVEVAGRRTNDVTVLSLAASDSYALPEPLEDEPRISKRGQTREDHLMAYDTIEELRRYVPFNPGKHWKDKDSDIDWNTSFLQRNTEHELFINEVGSEVYRPEPHYEDDIPNLFFAGDFCRSTIDITTVEAAVISGLQAARALWETTPLGEPISISEPDKFPRSFANALKLLLVPYAVGAKAWSMAYDAAAQMTGEVKLLGDDRDVVQFVVRAALAAMTSDLNLWRRRTGVCADSALEIGRALQKIVSDSGQRGEAQGMLLDAVRAFFRNLAELPADESRWLQTTLDSIAEQVWPAAQAQPQRRRWRVKR